MSKRYELLKDLPDLKAGEVYVWCDATGAYEPERFISIINNGGEVADNSYYWFPYRTVEGSSEWFRLIPDIPTPTAPTPPTTLQDQDNFQYTEEDLKDAFEAARRTDNEKMFKSVDAKLGHTYINVGFVYPYFEDYLSSKQPNTTKVFPYEHSAEEMYNELNKETTPSQPQNKERIRVIDFFFECHERGNEKSYVLQTSDSIPDDKRNAIKQAIESIINS